MSKQNGTEFDGFYAAYFTGVAGNSLGLFAFSDGSITGVDVGDGQYKGNYKISVDGRFVVGNVEFLIPVGSHSIVGAKAETEPLTMNVPIKLPIAIDPEEVHRIETPAGPVNAKFRKLRDL